MKPNEPLEIIEDGAQGIADLEATVGQLSRRVRLSESMARVLGHARTGKPGGVVRSFAEALDGFVALVKNRHGFASHKRRYLLEEAASMSDFPLLFGNVLEREILAKYRIATPDWRQYIGAGAQGDFRASGAEVFGILGLQAPIPAKQENGEYVQDKELDEGKVAIKLTEYGRRFGLGWRVLLADTLGAFSDIPDRLVQGALAREYLQATSLFVASTGPSTALFGAPITHPIDGTSITNKGTLKLTLTNIGTAIQKMLEQVDIDGNPIAIEGFELVYPPALAVQALTILESVAVVVRGTTDEVRGEANVIRNFNIRPHMNPWLRVVDTSANKDTTWYLFARLSNGRAAQLNFLRGHEMPELVMKASNKVTTGGGPVSPMEGDFESDTIHWRVRHICGGIQIDPRLAHAEDGTT